MNEINQLKNALGEPFKKVIGGQELEFYPLEVTYLPEFFELYGKLEGKTDDKALAEVMTKRENSKIMVDLVVAMVKNSFPENSDEVIIKRFCMKYFLELQEVLVLLHNPQNVDKRKMTQIKKMRERVNKAKGNNVQLTGAN